MQETGVLEVKKKYKNKKNELSYIKIIFTRNQLQKRSSGLSGGSENCWIPPPALLHTNVLPQRFSVNLSLKTFNEPGLRQVQIFFYATFFFIKPFCPTTKSVIFCSSSSSFHSSLCLHWFSSRQNASFQTVPRAREGLSATCSIICMYYRDYFTQGMAKRTANER